MLIHGELLAAGAAWISLRLSLLPVSAPVLKMVAMRGVDRGSLHLNLIPQHCPGQT